jgi:DNA-directed RNA polymerase specialized sigma24 family protein
VTLESDAFQALLRSLDSDPEQAAAEYRRLHQRLVRFFLLQPVTDPYRLADEALDRLARRIEASPDEIQSPASFLFGIAHHLRQEEERRERRESAAVAEWASHLGSSSAADEKSLQQVERCLSKMKKEQRDLLLSYYRSTGKEKIEHHRQLAADFGITVNALRNRLMRARRELDSCVRGKDGDVSARRSTVK